MKILTLRISLVDSNPEIWRRFQISNELMLGDLHRAIQIVMGWTNSHPHDFEIKGKRYSAKSDYGGPFDEPCGNEDETLIGDVLKQKRQKFAYIYDMGDDWQHKLVVEAIAEPIPGQHYPVCLAGENACPPEDCGGVWGYYRLLEILDDPDHDEYDEIEEWISDDFDAETFDIKETNEILENFDEYISGWDLDDE